MPLTHHARLQVAEHSVHDASTDLAATSDQQYRVAPISPRAWFEGAAAKLASVAAAAAAVTTATAAAPTRDEGYDEPVAKPAKAASKEGKVLHPDLINPNILKTQYAVRGELYLKAEEMRRAGKEVIFTNSEWGGGGRSAVGRWVVWWLNGAGS